jgi:ATPase subunit of ABC transporter with duplicated ATPase domains
VVTVSHSEHFLTSTCSELWVVRGGGVRVVHCPEEGAMALALAQYRDELKGKAVGKQKAKAKK